MLKRIVSGIMLTLILIVMLTFAAEVQLGKAESTSISLVGPIINPQVGQYANYVVNSYHENRTLYWSGWWNFSYIEFLAADLINVTHTIVTPEFCDTLWLVVNVTDRWIPYGNHWWVDSWYVPWIETNITVGSVIKMWKTDGTVIGTALSTIMLNGQARSIDCWEVQMSEPENPSQIYTFLFDKQIGVGIEGILSYEPYMKWTLASTNIPIGTSLLTTINIDPHSLNLRSKGKWITGYIELPEGYDVNDVNVSSILLNNTILVDLEAPTAIGDYDNDTIPNLMVKFNRTAVSEFILSKGIKYGNVTLTLTGNLLDGTSFEGSDTITVRMPGDVNVDGKVDGKDVALTCKAFCSHLGQSTWNPMADENEDGKIDGKDIALITKNYGKTYQ